MQDDCDVVLRSLLALAFLSMHGQANPGIAAWLCCAVLVALPKKDSSAKPIALGDVPLLLASAIMA